MKGFGLFMSMLVIVQWGVAQNSFEFASSELRLLVGEMELEHANNVERLIQWNDSLLVNRKKWQVRYDSLFTDTLALAPSERLLIQMDAAIASYVASPSQKMYLIMRAGFLEFDLKVEGAKGYMRELNMLILEVALEYQDFELAYRIQNRVHADNYSDWKRSDEARIKQLDSLDKVIVESSLKSKTDLDVMSRLAMQWHLTAVVFIALFVLVVITLIVLLSRWKKQRGKLAARANDTTEEEALVHKLEEARREIQELRLLAKKKVDPLPAQVVVPAVPTGTKISASEIAEWNDQVQQALVKIKTHCEAGKNSMSVPTYMSIINDTTRLSAQVAKKTEQWIALLNASI